MSESKSCGKCKRVLPIADFYKRSEDGRQYLCKQCARQARQKYRDDPEKYQRELNGRVKWRREHPTEAAKIDRLRNLRKHNITLDEYERMHREQKGCCAICGRPEHVRLKGKLKRLAVDHDHKTGKIRGLLCNQCNQGIGCLGDTPYAIERALAYLNAYTK